MDSMNRRKVLKVLGAAPAMAGIAWTEAEAQQAHQHAQQAKKSAAAAKAPYKPKYFTPHEMATVTALANLIIPKDERSGNASEAGVPEFIDYMMIDQPDRQTMMRGGLRWLDSECRKRYGQPFVKCTEAQQTEDLRCARVPGQGQAGALAWRPLLQRGPGPDGHRLLHEQDRHRRPRLQGQHVRGQVDRGAQGGPRPSRGELRAVRQVVHGVRLTMVLRVAGLILGVGALAAGPLLLAQAPAPTPKKDVAKVWTDVCASCHGATMQGAQAPSMLDDTWVSGNGDDASLALTIKNGRVPTGMPAFGTLLSDEDIRAMIVYIRETAGKAKAAGAGYAAPAANVVVQSEKHPFKVETVLEGVTAPWGLDFLPDGRMLITEKGGPLRIADAKGVLRPSRCRACRPSGRRARAACSTWRCIPTTRRTAGSTSRTATRARTTRR